MVERVIRLLIALAVIALIVGLVLWAIAFLGIALPVIVERAIILIGVLFAILYIWWAFGGNIGRNINP